MKLFRVSLLLVALASTAALTHLIDTGAFHLHSVHAQSAALQTGREQLLENDAVKVWKSTILPSQQLSMHHHDHPRIIIALQGGTMKIVPEHGEGEIHPWQTGHAYWLPSMPAGALHSDNNIGDKPIEVFAIELKHEP